MDKNAPKSHLTEEALAALVDLRRALRGEAPLSPRYRGRKRYRSSKSSKSWRAQSRVFYSGPIPYVKPKAARPPVVEAVAEGEAIEAKSKHKGKRTRRREREAKRAAARLRRRGRP